MPSKKTTKRAKSTKSKVEDAAQTENKQSVRTTIMLPQAVDENLGIYVLRNNTSRSEVIANLLIEFLTQQGYQPLKRPKLDVSY